MVHQHIVRMDIPVQNTPLMKSGHKGRQGKNLVRIPAVYCLARDFPGDKKKTATGEQPSVTE